MSETIYYIDTNNGNDTPVPASELGGGTLVLKPITEENVVRLGVSYNDIVNAVNSGKSVILQTMNTGVSAEVEDTYYYYSVLEGFSEEPESYGVIFSTLPTFVSADPDAELTYFDNPYPMH